MEKKFRKLELIEVPMSELEQSALDEILAGYHCTSYYREGQKEYCSGFTDGNCNQPGFTSVANYCHKYASQP